MKKLKRLLPNIHELITDPPGAIYYVVCTWDESANRYVATLDISEQKITGCYVESARTLKAFTKYTKKQAYSRASYLYGYARIAKRF